MYILGKGILSNKISLSVNKNLALPPLIVYCNECSNSNIMLMIVKYDSRFFGSSLVHC